MKGNAIKPMTKNDLPRTISESLRVIFLNMMNIYCDFSFYEKYELGILRVTKEDSKNLIYKPNVSEFIS